VVAGFALMGVGSAGAAGILRLLRLLRLLSFVKKVPTLRAIVSGLVRLAPRIIFSLACGSRGVGGGAVFKDSECAAVRGGWVALQITSRSSSIIVG